MPSQRRPIRPAGPAVPVGPVGPPEESLGPLLAQLRAERGLSQLRLAERLCAAAAVPTVTRHEVSRWEREERVPGPFWLGWLAAVLEVPARRLVAARLVAVRRGRGRAAEPAGAPAGTDRAARARRAATG